MGTEEEGMGTPKESRTHPTTYLCTHPPTYPQPIHSSAGPSFPFHSRTHPLIHARRYAGLANYASVYPPSHPRGLCAYVLLSVYPQDRLHPRQEGLRDGEGSGGRQSRTQFHGLQDNRLVQSPTGPNSSETWWRGVGWGCLCVWHQPPQHAGAWLCVA